MKKIFQTQFFLLFLSLIFVLVFPSIPISAADTPTPTQSGPTPSPSPTPNNTNAIDDIQKKISDLEHKVSGLKDQEKTLSSAIAVADNQMKLTQFKMDATEQQISSLSHDISIAEKRITNLDGTLNDITKALISRVRQTYQLGTVQPMQILLTSNNVSNFITRLNYLRIIQAHDRRLMYDTQQAKNDYANQKNIFEAKKQKIEALKADLQKYADQLDQEKKDKQALLTRTKNDDSLYQQQLDAARAEQAAITQIAAGGGNDIASGSVNQGDIVGYMIVGKSACSSGTHLHYEVHKGGSLQDASAYLANKSVIFDNSPDSPFSFTGSYDMPLSDPVKIEQGFGMTYWARTGWYGGGPHTGIDMYSDTSTAVHAVKAGKLYRGGIACGGGQLLYARVEQDDGVQSYYLHIVQ